MSLILSGTDGLSDVDGSAATPAIRGTDANTGMFFPAADTIAFSEGGVESMRIDSAGNVGIGISSPVAKLDVNGSIYAGGAVALSINSAGSNYGQIGYNTGTGDVYWLGYGNSKTTAGTAVLNWNSSGNVGIGTSSPLARLHIEGNSSGTVQTFIKNANGSTNSNAELVFGLWSGAIPTGTGNPGPSAKISAINIANADARTDLAFFTYSGSGSSTERMRILNTGNILCLAGGSTTATGTGIAFPATQSASSDANTLDDYEEGTFTPVLNFGGGTTGITYTSQKGYYAKIGRNVYFSIYVYLSSKGSSSGAAAVTGLPFTTSNNSVLGDIYLPVAQRNAITSSFPVFVYSSNETKLAFYSTSLSGGSSNILTESAFGNLAEFNIQGWYQTTN